MSLQRTKRPRMCQDHKTGEKHTVTLEDGTQFFIHITPKCEHDFKGWRTFDDGRGGEQVCTKCGMGAMAHSLREGP